MLDVSADQKISPRRIRLVIADRQPIVQQGLRSLFAAQHDFEIVASCSRGASCLEAIRNLAPDVALLDSTLPDLTGFEILAIAKAEKLPTRLVFFVESEEHDLAAAIAAGASSAISKYANPDIILRSLRLMTERISTPPERFRDLAPNGKEVDGAKIEKMLETLTDRERQIMRLVSEGLSNKEIARELNVSQGTVKVHLYNMFQKLEIGNRTVLATIALLERSAGLGTLSLAVLALAISSDLKASDTNDTFLDDDSTAYKDLEHSGLELWKKAILQQIPVVDPGKTVVFAQRDSSIKPIQVTGPPARMEELPAAEHPILSSLGRGYGPIGSSAPYLSILPLLQPSNNNQIGIGATQQQFPPLAFASNPMRPHGGFGTFAATAAGVSIYALDNSHAAVQALDPGETLIDTSMDGIMDGVHSPSALKILGHDGVTGAGNAGQTIQGEAGADTVNDIGLVDVSRAGSGNDAIEGEGGYDTVYGGSGSDTINSHNGSDTIIGGYGRDRLTGSSGDDIFFYLSATDSSSTQFDTITGLTSGEDKINLAAFGALAFLHMTPTTTSVPPHTLAWVYNPATNETILFVNSTDRSLDVGDPALLEIHLQGVVSVADSDFVSRPDAAAVAAALEGIDPALMLATATDGTVLMTGSADAGASESTSGNIWIMPADDGLSFNFARDRISSTVSSKLTSSGDDSAYATEESDDGSVNVPAHISSIELAHGRASVLIEENLAFWKEPAQVNTGGATSGYATVHGNAQHPPQAASPGGMEAAEPIEAGGAPGNSASHGNSHPGSQSASANSAAPEPAEPEIKPDNGVDHGNTQHPSQSASPSVMGAAGPIEPGGAPGNSAGHGNSPRGSQSSSANSATAEPAEPDIKPDNGVSHGNAQHPSHPESPSVTGAAEPIEPGVAPGNSGGHGNSQRGSQSASANGSEAAEPLEFGSMPPADGGSRGNSPQTAQAAAETATAEPARPELTPGKGGSNGNGHHASHSAAANASAASQPPEPASATGDEGSFVFHFSNKGGPFTPTITVELEELNSPPLLLGHGVELAEILQGDATAMHEHADHVDDGQHHAMGHLPHELLT